MSRQKFTDSCDRLSGFTNPDSLSQLSVKSGKSNMTSFKEILSGSFCLFLTITRINIPTMEERLPDFNISLREHGD